MIAVIKDGQLLATHTDDWMGVIKVHEGYEGCSFMYVNSINPGDPAPDYITKLQFFEQANSQGLWPSIQAALNGNVAAGFRFQMATMIMKTDPDFVAMATAMGMTQTDIDTFFLNASTQL